MYSSLIRDKFFPISYHWGKDTSNGERKRIRLLGVLRCILPLLGLAEERERWFGGGIFQHYAVLDEAQDIG